ncbi:hypothetical protein PoB_002717800 [Plakobranchus ocellatus]|uniref:Uncharacterized protein n=1 Tax=Plakobranchus ocellatus TaxID=259542 RepID=A0AAV4A229_9GAST|nr:hypothetical protein PoB_002717800 [Plakobranchus ocellatus]
MPRLMSQFERARNLISQPPEKRMEHEILQLVPWLRSKAKLFKQLKSVHNKVISGFEALHQAGVMAGLDPATEGSLQSHGASQWPR